MKKVFSIIAAAALIVSCTSKKAEQAEVANVPQFSTFSDHIMSVARQDSISLLEAAKWCKSVGVTGVDARTSLTPEQMQAFDEAGLGHACAILDIAHVAGPYDQLEEEAIEFCAKYGFTRLMYCPPLLPADATEEDVDAIIAQAKAFAEKVMAAGYEFLFECYDNTRAIVYNKEGLDKVYASIPNAKQAFDSGNFFYAGDDPMEAFAHFRDRIAHVHLKDRFKMADGASPALGVGIVPCRQILDQLVSTGYDGWFCIEGYGAKDMKEHLKISVENMTK